MQSVTHFALTLVILGAPFYAQAAPAFTGKWQIDLRNSAERRQKAECGASSFSLHQLKDRITGTHSFATAHCGRLNESGPVKGVAVGNKAVLVVTSSRNGAVVLGTATLVGGNLHWQALEEVRQGEPSGDSNLILDQGMLRPVSQ